jgi:hypothetical protein
MDSGVMQCSKCLTGVWHDEFSRKVGTRAEFDLARWSEYNMITPFDQAELVMVAEEAGYSIHPTATIMVNEMLKHYKDTDQKDKLDNNYSHIVKEHPLYRVWVEDPMNFVHRDDGYISNLNDTNEIALSILDSQHYPEESKSSTYKDVRAYNRATAGKSVYNLHNYHDMMEDTVDLLAWRNMTKRAAKKPHWKETQSPIDKERNLKLASLKRKIKTLKRKSFKTDNDNLVLNKLHVDYNILKG